MPSEPSPTEEPTETKGAPAPADEHVLPAGARALASVRERFEARVGEESLAVLLDNTTCYNAALAVSSDRVPDAHGLLDLSVFTVAAVCFDRIAVLPHMFPVETMQHQLTADIRGVIWPLPTTSADNNAFEGVYATALRNTKLSRNAHELQWKTLLNRDVEINGDLADPYYLADPVFDLPTLVSRDENADVRSRYASLQTVRAEFNDLVADAMGLPYMTSSVRLAPASALRQVHAQMLKALREAAGAVAPSASAKRGATFQAPFLLGVLLGEMKAPDEYPTKLADLRDQFEGFRKWLREHSARARWEDQPQELTKEFPQRLNGALHPNEARGKTLASVTAGAARTGEPTIAVAAGATQIIQTARGSSRIATLVARLFRPQLRPLLNVAREAKQVQTLSSQLTTLWGEPLRREDQLALAEIAQYDADPLLTRIYN